MTKSSHELDENENIYSMKMDKEGNFDRYESVTNEKLRDGERKSYV